MCQNVGKTINPYDKEPISMERLIPVGSVPVRTASQILRSRLGIGFEKLDRGLFDPAPAYDFIARLGVKRVRLQSGWARSETRPGHYDFAWLDEIVDQLRRRGLTPWLCLCYGNALYTEKAAGVFGAVGCAPVETAKERNAWSSYVRTLTGHFRGRIADYEVWNEPDGGWTWRPRPDGTAYGEFVKATARAARDGDPDAKIIAGACFSWDLGWLDAVFATGAADAMDALSVHAYHFDERLNPIRFRAVRALAHRYNPELAFLQGETGAQSRSDGAGAHAGAAWTPLRQTKYLLRHLVGDLAEDVAISSYFSAVDMAEALNSTEDDAANRRDYGYFGVLASEFSADGIAVNFTPKPSYRALQTAAAIFHGDFEPAELPVLPHALSSNPLQRIEDAPDTLSGFGFRRPDGSAVWCYWKPAELLTTEYRGTASFEVAGLPATVRLIDPMDGGVYRIPDAQCEKRGGGSVLFRNLPLTDYPLLLDFGDFAGDLP